MRKTILMLGLLPLLAACGTPEFQAEQSICTSDWLKKIPPKMENQLVQRYRYIQVPTGQTTCTTVGTTQNCVAKMRTETIPYTVVEAVDVNAGQRNIQIKACAERACTAKFGNPQCKAG